MAIYLDYASTTPLLPEVKQVMLEVMNDFPGNPSSIHAMGRQAKTKVEDARKTIAKSINASLGEVFFTAGATESNNMVLTAAVRDLGIKRVITSNFEHHCVMHTLDYLSKKFGLEVINIPVDSKGIVDPQKLQNTLAESDKPTLVSIMHANNEIGTMIDLMEISEICKNNNSLFHSDIAQSFGKYQFDVQTLKVDFLAASAHKLYGPKGTGFIFINEDINISALIHGGGQERNMRSGTENVIGICGFAKATSLAYAELESRHKTVEYLRSYFENRILDEISDTHLNGRRDKDYLYNVSSISFPASEKAELLVFNLDIAGICVSSGSACSSGVENDSHVMKAISHDPKRKTIRFSISHLTSQEELDTTINTLKSICG